MAANHDKEHLPVPAQATTPAATTFGPRRRIVTCCALVAFAFVWSTYHLRFAFSTRLFLHAPHSLYNPGAGDSMPSKIAEEIFLSVPNYIDAIRTSRLFATKPHLAGSSQDLTTAKQFLTILQDNLGIDPPLEEPVFSAGTSKSRNATLSIPLLDTPTAWIDTYYPVLDTPLDRGLEILDDDGNIVWKANLEEVPDDADPEAAMYFDAVPAFHGLSADAEVTGKLVYAKYGRKEDFDELIASGVDLKGKIVIARYGRNFRGLKIKAAQEVGAAGVLVYNDLHDDGTVTEVNGYAPYPHGPARNPDSVQRGSVQFISMYPGDPTTPGFPSYEDSLRLDPLSTPSIPSLPISWNNAQVLLKEIAEGGSNRTVKLVNHVDKKVTPIWNTMGVIPGHIKSEIVILGNHRDAWVMGAADPTSGTVTVTEVIRGFGILLKLGWKPLRTIVIASWDGEEYGLVGSTEWGEDFSAFIKDHVVAYVNIDVSVAGSRFAGEASPSLAHLLRDTAMEISHPLDPMRTLWDARNDRGKLFGKDIQEDKKHISATDSFGVGSLGSGSDYTVFLQRLGIPSVDAGFKSTLSDSVYHYHSIYDSERWQELYGDPGFVKHLAVAKHLGLQTLRLADSIILPINTTHYAYELEAYLDEVEQFVQTSPSIGPEVNLAPLRRSIQALQTASLAFDKEKNKARRTLERLLKRMQKKRGIHKKIKEILCKLKKLLGKKCHGHDEEGQHEHDGERQHGHDYKEPLRVLRDGQSVEFRPRIGRLPGLYLESEMKNEGGQKGCSLQAGHPPLRKFVRAVQHVQAVNKKLSTFEQTFISEDGLKDREWYLHLGVAPGKWKGYGATPLPGLTEAFTIENNATLAQYEHDRLKAVVDELVKKLTDKQ